MQSRTMNILLGFQSNTYTCIDCSMTMTMQHNDDDEFAAVVTMTMHHRRRL